MVIFCLKMVSYVKLFNQTVDEFFRELIDIFPEQTKIKVQYNLFKTLCMTNVKKPCKDFMTGSVPHLEKICMKDASMFKGKDAPDLLNNIGFENIWTDELSQNTKDAIWNYIKSFFTIGVHVVQMPQECIPMLDYIINN